MTDYDTIKLAEDILAEAERHGQNNKLARAVLSQHTRIRELEGQLGIYQDLLKRAAKENSEGDPTALARKVCDEHRDLPYPVAYALAKQVFRDNEHKAALMLRISELEAALGEALQLYCDAVETFDPASDVAHERLRKLLEKP